MTYEKAKEVIKAEYYIRDYTFSPELAEALEIADEALEKQVPKKPTREYTQSDGTIIYSPISLLCPRCGESIGFRITSRNGKKIEYTYCQECGQAIDWSDE